MKSENIISKAIIVLMACLFLMTRSMGAFCQTLDGFKPIVISQVPTEVPNTPRSINPFYSFQDGLCIILGATYQVGKVVVTVTSIAGDYYSTEFDTQDGTIVLPISGMCGLYTMTLVTAEKIVFVGDFSL